MLRFKSAFLILSLLFAFSLSGQTQNYSNGYQKGYKEGYCYNDYGCIAPQVPLTRIPNINEDVNSFENGYQRGFIDGRNAKSQSSSNRRGSQYAHSDFGSYQNPVNTSFVSQAFSTKQQRYNSQKAQYSSNSSDSEIWARIEREYNSYIETFNEKSKFANSIQGLFDFSKNADYALTELYNVNSVRNQYAESITVEEGMEIIRKLKANNARLVEYFGRIEAEVEKYMNSPNDVILGTYNVEVVTDHEYDYNTKKYRYKELIASSDLEDSYMVFKENKVFFKRPNEKPVKAFLMYEGWNTETQTHLLRDGWGQLIVVKPNSSFVKYYYDDDGKGQYKKKTDYYIPALGKE